MAAPEEWRDVAEYEGVYEVSDLGHVRRVQTGAILKPIVTPRGHYRITLRNRGNDRHVYVHRLVALAFLGQPEEGQEVCHNNSVPGDNRVANLRWDTRQSNVDDRPLVTECPAGHPYDEENTLRYANGHRRCRACHRDREKARYYRGKSNYTA